jgi:addiction module HigA family antidote
MIPKHRKPVTPGEILLKEFLIPMGISQVSLAKKMSVPVQRINTVINNRRDMTAETAVLLSLALGTTVEFWMNLQVACDIYKATQRLGARKYLSVIPAPHHPERSRRGGINSGGNPDPNFK